jgi:hypothetical protein
MTSLTREELRPLRDAEPPCVSIYLPTDRPAVEIPRNRIRLKNLLREAEDQLLARGDKHPGRVLMPGLALVDDVGFWQHPTDGLALFLAPGTTHHYRVHQSFRELAFVGDRFHLAPLLPLIGADGHFHLLALSQKNVRLFLGGAEGLRELELRGVPRSVQEALNYDVTEHSLQYHSVPATPQTVGSRGRPSGGAGQAVPTGRRQGMFHGHGVVDDDAKEQVRRFMEVLADSLDKVWHVHQPPLPLVLAGVDYERAMFREATRHPRLVEAGVEGSPDSLADEELERRARPIVEPVLHEEERHAVAVFQDRAGTSRASTDFEEVLLAAADGRVDKLFYDPREQRWGRLDYDGRTVEVHPERQNGDEDLVDRAAVETVFHGGCVYAVGPEQGALALGPVAAVFRY